MQFTFTNDINFQNYEIIITLGESTVQRLQIPSILAEQQYEAIVQQLRNDGRPMRAECLRDEYTDSGKKIKNSIIFENKAYVRAYGKDD